MLHQSSIQGISRSGSISARSGPAPKIWDEGVLEGNHRLSSRTHTRARAGGRAWGGGGETASPPMRTPQAEPSLGAPAPGTLEAEPCCDAGAGPYSEARPGSVGQSLSREPERRERDYPNHAGLIRFHGSDSKGEARRWSSPSARNQNVRPDHEPWLLSSRQALGHQEGARIAWTDARARGRDRINPSDAGARSTRARSSAGRGSEREGVWLWSPTPSSTNRR